ncbi:MAG: FecR domain-containing protein [Pseudomonadota bacterium]
MKDQDGADQHWAGLLGEAADIYTRFQQAPEDAEILAERAAFLARGAAEERAYRHINKVWQASGVPKRTRSKALPVLLALLVCGLAFFGYDPMRNAFLADHRTGAGTDQVTLLSGDRVDMDAATALADATETGARRVELLDGAAFFTVEKNPRPFVVTLGSVEVEAVGTAFETAFLDGGVLVAIAEGKVIVREAGREWPLEPEDRLFLTGDNKAQIGKVGIADIAGWRSVRMTANGMTLAEVAAILDRRIPGPVLILASDLAEERITGSFDLSDPESALRNLAASVGGSVISAGPLGAILTGPEKN